MCLATENPKHISSDIHSKEVIENTGNMADFHILACEKRQIGRQITQLKNPDVAVPTIVLITFQKFAYSFINLSIVQNK